MIEEGFDLSFEVSWQEAVFKQDAVLQVLMPPLFLPWVCGWYVQGRYGNKVLALGKGNAVFVKALKDVQGALQALKVATEAVELGDAVEEVIKRAPKNEAFS